MSAFREAAGPILKQPTDVDTDDLAQAHAAWYRWVTAKAEDKDRAWAEYEALSERILARDALIRQTERAREAQRERDRLTLNEPSPSTDNSPRVRKGIGPDGKMISGVFDKYGKYLGPDEPEPADPRQRKLTHETAR